LCRLKLDSSVEEFIATALFRPERFRLDCIDFIIKATAIWQPFKPYTRATSVCRKR
jgi:hypothetical protein